MSNTLLQATSINKFFHKPVEFQVLTDVSFTLNSGEFVSVMGKSGCGKSTLLYILSTMDTDYDGYLEFDGQTLTGMPADELAYIRNKKIGFVFQFHYLLNEFTVLQNVMLPALKLGERSEVEIEDHAMEILKLLEVDDQALKKASRLSGGQKQRIAIARALINDPLLLMGDEPTGNLDSKNTDIVFSILRELSSEKDRSMLVVTHDPDFAKKTDRIIEMSDGRVINHDMKL